MLFKKRGLFTDSDAMRVIEIASSRENAGEIIVMCEAILWDYANGVKLRLMADLIGEQREIRVEILEG